MKTLVIANWKMNPCTQGEAQQLFESIKSGFQNAEKAEVVICPPFIYLPAFQEVIEGIKLGSQDCFCEDKGAFTGEVSAKMLKEMGCEYAILGHSERRIFSGETDEMINKKIKSALQNNFKVILCIGDANRESKEDDSEMKPQLEKDLAGITKEDLDNIFIAYEPLWAISTMGGQAATPEDIKRGVEIIRNVLAGIFDKDTASKAKVLYGGSVNSGNAKEVLSGADVCGFLVGGASLKAEEFIKIINNI